ncbi:hypothetical protein BGX24_011271 [Mortierella sp. AD032]|nr:hypothetical protein BGX24_011271 [Mortierella sp. AD032]
MDSTTPQFLTLPEMVRHIAAHPNNQDLLSFMMTTHLLLAVLEPCFYRGLVTTLTITTITITTVMTVGSTEVNENRHMPSESHKGMRALLSDNNLKPLFDQSMFDVVRSTTTSALPTMKLLVVLKLDLFPFPVVPQKVKAKVKKTGVRKTLLDKDDPAITVLRVCSVLSDLAQLRNLDLNAIPIKTRPAKKMLRMTLGKMNSMMNMRVSLSISDIRRVPWMLSLACPPPSAEISSSRRATHK